MAGVRDPVLDPVFQNELVEAAVKHYEDAVRLLMQNLWPNGYMVGESPIANKVERLITLMQVHDRNLAVVNDPAQLPGNQARANQELLEEEELKAEVFAA